MLLACGGCHCILAKANVELQEVAFPVDPTAPWPHAANGLAPLASGKPTHYEPLQGSFFGAQKQSSDFGRLKLRPYFVLVNIIIIVGNVSIDLALYCCRRFGCIGSAHVVPLQVLLSGMLLPYFMVILLL